MFKSASPWPTSVFPDSIPKEDLPVSSTATRLVPDSVAVIKEPLASATRLETIASSERLSDCELTEDLLSDVDALVDADVLVLVDAEALMLIEADSDADVETETLAEVDAEKLLLSDCDRISFSYRLFEAEPSTPVDSS
ncbi:TPA: hypothetical protein U2C24_001246 [Streptococcus suis]|nr:hypothetical protein [Streptococcus suis]